MEQCLGTASNVVDRESALFPYGGQSPSVHRWCADRINRSSIYRWLEMSTKSSDQRESIAWAFAGCLVVPAHRRHIAGLPCLSSVTSWLADQAAPTTAAIVQRPWTAGYGACPRTAPPPPEGTCHGRGVGCLPPYANPRGVARFFWKNPCCSGS